jgi:hypothetical protein
MDPAVMVLFMILGGGISAAIASSKRRNVAGYLALGALMPLIGIIAIACLPALPEAGETNPGY